MGGQHIPNIVGTVWQQAFDRSAAGIRIIDAVSLNSQPPGFIEDGLVVRSLSARLLDRLYKEGSRIIGIRQQDAAVPIDVGIDVIIEVKEIWEDEPEWLGAEEG